MSIRKIIGSISALLVVWLITTYFYQVPTERYPSQLRQTAEKASIPASAELAVAAVTSQP